MFCVIPEIPDSCRESLLDTIKQIVQVGKVLKLFSFLADSIDLLDVGMYEEACQ